MEYIETIQLNYTNEIVNLDIYKSNNTYMLFEDDVQMEIMLDDVLYCDMSEDDYIDFRLKINDLGDITIESDIDISLN